MTEREHDIERAHALANLQNDMRDLLAAERNKIGSGYLVNTNRPEFHEEELTDEDAEIWEAWKSGALDPDRLKAWGVKLEKEEPGSLKELRTARAAFGALMGNIIMVPPERRAEWLERVRAKARG